MMAGYCTTCGGSGYRRPGRENKRADFVDQIARMAPYDEFDTEDARDALNALIKAARRFQPQESSK
jgi:hypothetical protein